MVCAYMTTASISQLKVNPSAVIADAVDYPVAVENRNKVEAYLVGKVLFEKLIALLEDLDDSRAVKQTDFSKGRSFEDFASEFGL
jgi:antitoxin StbD